MTASMSRFQNQDVLLQDRLRLRLRGYSPIINKNTNRKTKTKTMTYYLSVLIYIVYFNLSEDKIAGLSCQ
jgi:hypothetical protein